ncbi:LuxR C-terminal-related transcriptional regulator [Phreatobacter stygius]|uniref:Response regulator transcription factor n=1 Tax=Phreatobacter stygius TaxID=1940610 RepID=A0A4D7BGX5_9HYPH|nr:response regulator transcription factor [Phreatobacter stygius]QCI68416.1 response regulator transcription factor [Phreatobacter stygius]
MRTISTTLVEVNPIFREGVGKILDGTMFRVVASVAKADELKPTASSELRAMLVILGASDDIGVTEQNIRALRQRFTEARIVVLADRYNCDELVEVFRLSVNGYLAKSISGAALIKSLELVMLGENIFPSAILMRIIDMQAPVSDAGRDDDVLEDTPIEQSPCLLSAREAQISRCLISGQSNKVIARNFNITEATVKVHIKAVLRKIGVRNRTQAAVWAINHLAHPDIRLEINGEASNPTLPLLSSPDPANGNDGVAHRLDRRLFGI